MAGDANTPTSDAASRRIDAVFDALCHRRRRMVLHHLRGVPGGVASIDDLATVLADRAGPDGPSAERVAASLVHHHLPKLVDAGIVEYDDAGAVRYRDDSVVSECLDLVAGVDSA